MQGANNFDDDDESEMIRAEPSENNHDDINKISSGVGGFEAEP